MRAVVLMTAAAMLAGCSPGDGAEKPAAAPPTKAARVLDDAQRAAMLAALPAPYNTADLANGRANVARCRSCHTLPEGGPKMTGPNLYGVFGRTVGTKEGFTYSKVVETAGFTWDAEKLDHWLENPRTFLPGTKMNFQGLPDANDRRDVIAFLMIETGYQPAAAAPAPAATPAP